MRHERRRDAIVYVIRNSPLVLPNISRDKTRIWYVLRSASPHSTYRESNPRQLAAYPIFTPLINSIAIRNKFRYPQTCRREYAHPG